MNNRDKKILYIDDNTAQKTVLENEVKKVCHPLTPLVASSLNEARELFKENSFEAIVSDFYLVDGQITDLLPQFGNSPLIIIIGKGSEDMVLKTLKASAYDYLIKDSNLNYLKLLPVTLTRSIELKKQRDELENYRTRLESLVRERTTELTEMYLQLQESEANFRNIFDNTSDSFIITDFDFNFLEANRTLLERFGVTKEFLSSHALIEFLAPEYHQTILDRLQNIKQGLSSPDMEIEVIAPLTRQIIPYEVNTVPFMFNHQNALLTVMRDITERKSNARKLFEAIIQTEEEERSRIARDLHDEIGPLISVLKIYTTSFTESNSTERKNKLASQISLIIRDVIESLKEISNDMSPHVLVNFGLRAAVQNIIKLFSKNIKIHQHLKISDLRFPITVEIVVYRIIKELINNTVKHGKAANIYILLDYTDSKLSFQYHDDGIGFNYRDGSYWQANGMGINNIISRIQSLGGDYTITTSPGNGFKIDLELKTSQFINNGKQQL